ncbi:alpha/beta hydrolase [Paenibacillus hamazuiensis]|uniref:alpha/beta hydrolase n=1 Tax=Paenibacillus hamazuiensis TaxID=2936508 RepID=UPI00200EDD26|nr:alpha/beta hydrolase family protein [Paenibacillus hamazuiensis]
MAWLHVHYHSETLRMPVPMEVLLPQHVSKGAGKTIDPGPYPALYLLHGAGDDHTAWLRRTSIERYAEDLPLAVVMPAGHLGWYTDMAYGRDYFTFIAEELPAVCERMFPLSGARERRFIAGADMGGYGAMKAGLLASDTFGAVASISGAMDAVSLFERLDPQLAADIFGSKETLPGSVNDLFAAAEQAARTDGPRSALYISCGTGDVLYEENVRFKEHALKLGLPLTFDEGPGDRGGWAYRDACLERLLKWLPLRESGAV